jgi:hypothetical protein
MQIIVENKEYKIEFTFEAAESDIVQTAFDYFSGAYMFKGMTDNGTEEEKRIKQVDAALGGISAMPRMAIDFFFMGLLENHGPCGEITQDIATRNDAKRLYKQFCKENPENELSMQSGLFKALREQMEKDGFFDRIGLTEVMQAMTTEETETQLPKVPQDRKKKSTKA